MNKNRIRLTESQLHNLIKESVKNVLINEGIWDKTKGAFNGMKQGFQKGQQQMQNDMYRNDRNESNYYDLTKYVMDAYKTLANCKREDEREMSMAIRNAEIKLMFALKNAGFAGFSDGSGTQWKQQYKPLYNKTNGYNGNIDPSSSNS